MKKSLALAVIAFACWFVYQGVVTEKRPDVTQDGIGVADRLINEAKGIDSETLADSSTKDDEDAEAGDEVAQIAEDDAAEEGGGVIAGIMGLFSGGDGGDAGDKGTEATLGANEIAGCMMFDDSGRKVDFGEVLDECRGRVLILHVNNADRPHCPRGDDKAHFQAINDIQSMYGDRVKTIGYNISGSPAQIKSFKTYYGMNYEMLTIPHELDSMKEAERVKAFYKSIGATDGSLLMPAAIFIKDGKYIAGTVSGLSGYSELEDALMQAM